jgi:hypothetical protein
MLNEQTCNLVRAVLFKNDKGIAYLNSASIATIGKDAKQRQKNYTVYIYLSS